MYINRQELNLQQGTQGLPNILSSKFFDEKSHQPEYLTRIQALVWKTFRFYSGDPK